MRVMCAVGNVHTTCISEAKGTCHRFIRSLPSSCRVRGPVVTGNQSMLAAVSQPVRHRGYFPSLPARCVKNGQYASMVWHLFSAARDTAFQCCCSWKMVFAELGSSFPAFEQNLPHERKCSSAFLVRRAQDLSKSHAFLPLCTKLARQPSLYCLCWSVHLLAGKIALHYVI